MYQAARRGGYEVMFFKAPNKGSYFAHAIIRGYFEHLEYSDMLVVAGVPAV